MPPITLFELEEKPDEVLKRSLENQEAIYQILSERSGIPIENIKKMCKEETSLTAQEALKLGFIDEIIDSDIEFDFNIKDFVVD